MFYRVKQNGLGTSLARVAARIVAPPRMVSEIVSLANEFLKGLSKNPNKRVVEKVRMDLRGWPYQSLVEKSRGYSQIRKNLGNLFIRMVPEVSRDFGDYANGILSLYLNPKECYSTEDIEGAVEHELIHYAQEILDMVTEGGFEQIPSGIGQPEINQHLIEQDETGVIKQLRQKGIIPGMFHDLDDAEFYPELNNALRRIKEELIGVEKNEIANVFDILVGITSARYGFRVDAFMTLLKEHAPLKWKEAIGEIRKGLSSGKIKKSTMLEGHMDRVSQIAERMAGEMAAGNVFWHGSDNPSITQFVVDDARFALIGTGVYLYKNKQSAKQYGKYLYRVDVRGLKIAPMGYKFEESEKLMLLNNLGIGQMGESSEVKFSGEWNPIWWCTDGWNMFHKDRKTVANMVSYVMQSRWDGMVVDYPNGGEVCVVWKGYNRLNPSLENKASIAERMAGEIIGTRITDYPHRTQGFAYDCGATAVLTVLQYYGYNNDKLNEQSVFDAIGTDVNGTDNEGIESGLQKLGMVFQRVLSLQEIDKHLEDGHPVVVCACTYPNDWHYMVLIAKDGGEYIVSDPWSVNLAKVPIEIFDKVWHEQDFTRWGIAVFGEPKYRGGIVPMDVKLAKISELGIGRRFTPGRGLRSSYGAMPWYHIPTH